MKALTAWLHRNLRQAWKKGELQHRSHLLQRQLCVLAEREGLFTTTPDCIEALLGELFEGACFMDMLDMCSGMSYAGYALWERVTAGSSETSYTGEEIDPIFCSIARISLYMAGVKQSKIIQRNILEPVAGEAASQYDFIVADLPRGNNRPLVCDGRDVRIKGFCNKKIYADWIFIQDMLGRLRQGGYGIALPANLYANVHTTTELLIFHKGKQEERKNRILFIDISSFSYRQNRGAWELSDEGISAAKEAFRGFRQLDGISVICAREELNWETISWKPQFRIRENDILLTSKGTVIKLVIAGEPQMVSYISGNITILRVNRQIYHPYVLYDYLQSEEGRRALESIQSGTTIRILNNANLKKLDIPAYPMDVMEKIGEKLRQNWLEYDRRQNELTARFLAQKQKLQQELKKELKKEAREDGENIFESQCEE